MKFVNKTSLMRLMSICLLSMSQLNLCLFICNFNMYAVVSNMLFILIKIIFLIYCNN